jgi:hypothetical protein
MESISLHDIHPASKVELNLEQLEILSLSHLPNEPKEGDLSMFFV